MPKISGVSTIQRLELLRISTLMINLAGDPEATPPPQETSAGPNFTGKNGKHSGSTAAIVGGQFRVSVFALGLNFGDYRCGWWSRWFHPPLNHRVLWHSAVAQERGKDTRTMGLPGQLRCRLENTTSIANYSILRSKRFHWTNICFTANFPTICEPLFCAFVPCENG